MGIGYVARGNNFYDGTAVVGAGKTIENGNFVDVTVSSSGITADLCIELPVTAPKFVANEDDTVDEEGINTSDIKFTEGKFLKLKTVLPGEVLVTSKADSSLVIGDIVFASNGILKKKTDQNAVQLFVVKEIDALGDSKLFTVEALN